MGAPGPQRLAVWEAVTPLGRAVAVTGVVALGVAWRTGWTELAVLGVACSSSLAIGLTFLVASRAGLSVALELGTPRVVVGNPASTKVTATNIVGRRTMPVTLETRIGEGVARHDVPSLAAEGSYDDLVVIATSRRSIVPVGPVRSVQGDPLGLVRREVTYTGEEQLFVHPKTVLVGSLTTGWRRDLEGETTNERSPSDVAFHTLREYVIGDDRRHIHWRTTARQPDGKLMVREFVDTRRAHLGLLLSLRGGDYATVDEFELAVSSLGSFGLRAIADEQEVSCVAGIRAVPSHMGTSFLDALSSLELGADSSDMVAIATRARDLLVGASVVVLISGSRADRAAMRQAAERLGSGVRPVIVEAAMGEVSVLQNTKRGPFLRVGALEDLPRLTWSVSLA